jgi:hypothetical protein
MWLKRIVCVALCLACLLVISGQSTAAQESSVLRSEADSSKIDKPSGSRQEELLTAKVSSLKPVISEMADSLEVLHAEYPLQIDLWKKTLLDLPEADSRHKRVEALVEVAELAIKYIVHYADEFTRQRKDIEALLSTGTVPKRNLIENYGRLAILYNLQEKIGFYEVIFQSTINELSQFMIGIWHDPNSLEFKLISTFREIQDRQIENFSKAHKDFYCITAAAQDISEALSFGLRTSLLINIDVSKRITAKLIKERFENTGDSHVPGITNPDLSISLELETIARRRTMENLSLYSAIGQNHTGSICSLLFVPEAEESQTARSNVPTPHFKIAGNLVHTLDNMRPVFKELVAILTARNQLLDNLQATKTNSLEYLRRQLASEALTLSRLNSVVESINQKALSVKEVVRDFEAAGLYEEFGYLKEELLAQEQLISFELKILLNSNKTFSDTDRSRVQTLVEQKINWDVKWRPFADSWKQVVNDYELYRNDLLERSMFANQDIRDHVVKIEKISASVNDQIGQKYLRFIGTVSLNRLEDTKKVLQGNRKSMKLGENDPFYKKLFGTSPEKFWHTYMGQGSVLQDLEHLIASKNNIISKLENLDFRNGVNLKLRALHILQIVQDMGLVVDLGRNPEGFVVVFGSPGETFYLEKLLGSQEPVLGQIASKQVALNTWFETFRSWVGIFQPRDANAGYLGDAWNNLKNGDGWNHVKNFCNNLSNNYSLSDHVARVGNQVSKNKYTYALGALGAGVALVVAAVASVPVATAATVAVGTTAIAAAGLLGKGLLVQAALDIGTGTTKTLVSAGNPAGAKDLNKYVDNVESCYNFSKFAQAGYNIFASKVTATVKEAKDLAAAVEKKAASLEKAGRDAVRAVEKATESKKLSDQLRRGMGEFLSKADSASRKILKDIMKDSIFNAIRNGIKGEEAVSKVTNIAKDLDKLKDAYELASESIRPLLIGTLLEAYSNVANAISAGTAIAGTIDAGNAISEAQKLLAQLHGRAGVVEEKYNNARQSADDLAGMQTTLSAVSSFPVGEAVSLADTCEKAAAENQQLQQEIQAATGVSDGYMAELNESYAAASKACDNACEKAKLAQASEGRQSCEQLAGEAQTLAARSRASAEIAAQKASAMKSLYNKFKSNGSLKSLNEQSGKIPEVIRSLEKQIAETESQLAGIDVASIGGKIQTTKSAAGEAESAAREVSVLAARIKGLLAGIGPVFKGEADNICGEAASVLNNANSRSDSANKTIAEAVAAGDQIEAQVKEARAKLVEASAVLGRLRSCHDADIGVDLNKLQNNSGLGEIFGPKAGRAADNAAACAEMAMSSCKDKKRSDDDPGNLNGDNASDQQPCPDGYVRDPATGDCVSPFDGIYDESVNQRINNEDSRSQSMADQVDADNQSRHGGGRFSSGGINRDMDKTQDDISRIRNDHSSSPTTSRTGDAHPSSAKPPQVVANVPSSKPSSTKTPEGTSSVPPSKPSEVTSNVSPSKPSSAKPPEATSSVPPSKPSSTSATPPTPVIKPHIEWHARQVCAENEGSQYRWRWRVVLNRLKSKSKTGFNVTGTISFHKCPGGGRVSYRFTGVVLKNGSFSVTGNKQGGRGGLYRGRHMIKFILIEGHAPSPNLAN